MDRRDGHRFVFRGDLFNKLMRGEERVVDRQVLKLVRAMLRAGVMEDGRSGGRRWHPAGRVMRSCA